MIVSHTTKAGARRNWNDCQLEIYLRRYVQHDGHTVQAYAVTSTETELALDSCAYTTSEPTWRLTDEAAQELMDALWAAGLRPVEGRGSAGQLAAVQAHLEDMRKLAFRSVLKENP